MHWTEGLTEKIYRKLVDQVMEKIPNLKEWHNNHLLKKIGNVSWKDAIQNVHLKNA